MQWERQAAEIVEIHPLVPSWRSRVDMSARFLRREADALARTMDTEYEPGDRLADRRLRVQIAEVIDTLAAIADELAAGVRA